MTTATEDLIKQLKRAKQKRTEAILVPLVEDFLKKPIEIEDKLDRKFLASLVKARSIPRRPGIYSPSMLASCVRQVYFTKQGVRKQRIPRIESNAIFLDGNFRHFKWQFVMWKMHRAGIVQLVDVGSICIGSEIWVGNEKEDFGGTIDNLLYIPSEEVVVTADWKGMNGNSFLSNVSKGPSLTYIMQSVGYGGLANSYLRDKLPKKIDSVLIIGENKNGAINTRAVKSPLGLQEWRFDLDDYRLPVAQRLKKLRSYERKQEIPPPECVSTRRMMFKDCPFSHLCRAEVEAVERRKFRKMKKKNPPKVRFNRNRGKKG